MVKSNFFYYFSRKRLDKLNKCLKFAPAIALLQRSLKTAKVAQG